MWRDPWFRKVDATSSKAPYNSKLNKSYADSPQGGACHADFTIAKACKATNALSDLLLSSDASARIADVRSALAGDARSFRSVITCAELKARELASVDFERPHAMPTRAACAILQEAVHSTPALRASLHPILEEVFRAMFENFDALPDLGTHEAGLGWAADSDVPRGKCLDEALPYHHVAIKLRSLCVAQEQELQTMAAERTQAVEALRVAQSELQLLRQRLKVSDATALLHAKRTMQHWLALLVSKCFGEWRGFVDRCKGIRQRVAMFIAKRLHLRYFVGWREVTRDALDETSRAEAEAAAARVTANGNVPNASAPPEVVAQLKAHIEELHALLKMGGQSFSADVQRRARRMTSQHARDLVVVDAISGEVKFDDGEQVNQWLMLFNSMLSCIDGLAQEVKFLSHVDSDLSQLQRDGEDLLDLATVHEVHGVLLRWVNHLFREYDPKLRPTFANFSGSFANVEKVVRLVAWATNRREIIDDCSTYSDTARQLQFLLHEMQKIKPPFGDFLQMDDFATDSSAPVKEDAMATLVALLFCHEPDLSFKENLRVIELGHQLDNLRTKIVKASRERAGSKGVSAVNVPELAVQLLQLVQDGFTVMQECSKISRLFHCFKDNVHAFVRVVMTSRLNKEPLLLSQHTTKTTDTLEYCHIDISRMHDVFVDDKRPTQSIKELEAYLSSVLRDIKRAYRSYSSLLDAGGSREAIQNDGSKSSGNAPPMLSYRQFILLANDTALIDAKLPAKAMDLLFVKAWRNLADDRKSTPQPDTDLRWMLLPPKRFVELLVHIAVVRYKGIPDVTSRVRVLLEDHVFCSTRIQADASKFRAIASNPDVLNLMHRYQEAVLLIFKHGVGSKGRAMSCSAFVKILKEMKLYEHAALSAQVAQLIFKSVQHGRTEDEHASAEDELDLREFREAILAVSLYCEPNPFKSVMQKAEELILKVVVPFAKKLGMRQR
jgi:hypothetical protein